MFKKLILGALLSALLFLTACGEGESSTSASDTSGLDPATLETAQRLHTAGNAQGATACQSCHSLDGTPLVGPTFQGIGAVAGERQPGVDAETYLRQSITQPAAYIVEGYSNAMPANYDETLSEEEIDALVEWMLTFDTPPSE